MKDIIIIAGGASVAEYDLQRFFIRPRRSTIIGVNDSALYTPCDYALTMDRLWIEHRQRLLRTLGKKVYYRKGTPKNFTPPLDWFGFEHDENTPELLAQRKGFLNGSNSGSCALNLAFQWQCNRIFLLGFDMQRGPVGEKHWYPDYPWATEEKSGTKPAKLREWAKEFRAFHDQMIVSDIAVYNVNHRSLITAFPVIDYEKFLETTC